MRQNYNIFLCIQETGNRKQDHITFNSKHRPQQWKVQKIIFNNLQTLTSTVEGADENPEEKSTDKVRDCPSIDETKPE